MVEDDIDKLIRKIKQRREDLVDILIKGSAPAENVAHGYFAIAAKIAACDEILTDIKEELANWATWDPMPRPTRRNVTDPAGY
jgi:hypothetical protein